jgi:hypothetical protein
MHTGNNRYNILSRDSKSLAVCWIGIDSVFLRFDGRRGEWGESGAGRQQSTLPVTH